MILVLAHWADVISKKESLGSLFIQVYDCDTADDGHQSGDINQIALDVRLWPLQSVHIITGCILRYVAVVVNILAAVSPFGDLLLFSL